MIGSGIFIVTASMSRDIGFCRMDAGSLADYRLDHRISCISYGELAGYDAPMRRAVCLFAASYGRMISFLYGWTVLL